MKLDDLYPGTLYYEGGKRAVILMHAYTGSPSDVNLLARFLNRTGYAVLLPMFSGHGTERPEDVLESNPTAWHEEAVKSIAFLKAEGFKEIAVFGLSLGGVYAMSLLDNEPEYIIGGGSFCSPLVPKADTNIIKNFRLRSRHLLTQKGVTGQEQEQRMEIIEPLLESQLWELDKLTQTVFKQMSTIKQPTLLVQAGQDQMIDPQTVYQAKEQLSQSASQLKWYPKSGHVITTGPERQQFQEDVLSFINHLPWSKEQA